MEQRLSVPNGLISDAAVTPLPHLMARFRFAARILAMIGGVLGTLALLGWIFDVIPLRSLMSGEITMKTNPAIGLMLVAGALLLQVGRDPGRWRRVTGLCCAGGAVLIGFLTLVQYAAGIDLHIDQLLFTEPPGSPATYSPNRMGTPAATSLTLLGLALMMVDVETSRGRRPSQYLAIVTALITLVPLIGYAYSIEPLYGRAGVGIAAQTAVGLAALALGVLCARPGSGLMAIVTAEGPGGVLARRMIVPSIVIPFILGWLRTLAEEHQLVQPAFGRTLLILTLIVIFTSLIWRTAQQVAQVGHERLLAQEALRESEQRFRVALNTAPVSVYTHDLELRYTWVHNPRPGFLPEEMLGKRDDELMPAEQVAELLLLKQRVLATGRGERRQIAMGGGGTMLVYDVSAEPLRGPDGAVAGLTVAMMDVTAIKANEQALIRAKADADAARTVAERANAAKDQFLAVLSHELRTPLTPVMTLVQMLEADRSLEEGVRESLSTIRRNIELEARLIDDLLDLTRVTHGKLTLRTEDVDVQELLEHVAAMCGPDARGRGLELELRRSEERYLVRGDPARLQQVFWNLLKNSIKFTPAGGRIEVWTERVAEGELQLVFRDSGIGIEAEALPRIFNAFEQADAGVARQFGGLGLGLAIAKAIVTLHGGTIEGSSAGAGTGTTFRITLPAMVAAGDRRPALALATDGEALRGLRVLVVEDNPDTVRALTRLLTMFGCKVTVATSVKTGIAALRVQHFDLMLSDLGLPDGTGHELMDHVRSQPQLKAIAISGFGMEQDVRRSLAAGFATHLTKPVDVGQLQKTLLEVVGRAGDAAYSQPGKV